MLFRNRYLESDLDCSSDEDEYELVPRKRQKQRGVSVWDGVKVERVEKIPPDINGKKVFELNKSKSGSRMSNVHDGRRWKKDSQTKWSGFSDVRYSDCHGSYQCFNTQCEFKSEYGIVNRSHFDKNNMCNVCKTPGRYVPCYARRFVAFLEKKVRVYHLGEHTCPVKSPVEPPKEEIEKQLRENPDLTPSQIQSNLIISQMRQGVYLYNRLRFVVQSVECTSNKAKADKC